MEKITKHKPNEVIDLVRHLSLENGEMLKWALKPQHLYVYKEKEIIAWGYCYKTTITMFVDPKHRRKGIGTKIVKKIKEEENIRDFGASIHPFPKYRGICRRIGRKTRIEIF